MYRPVRDHYIGCMLLGTLPLFKLEVPEYLAARSARRGWHTK